MCTTLGGLDTATIVKNDLQHDKTIFFPIQRYVVCENQLFVH